MLGTGGLDERATNADLCPCQVETIGPVRRTKRAPVWFACAYYRPVQPEHMNHESHSPRRSDRFTRCLWLYFTRRLFVLAYPQPKLFAVG